MKIATVALAIAAALTLGACAQDQPSIAEVPSTTATAPSPVYDEAQALFDEIWFATPAETRENACWLWRVNPAEAESIVEDTDWDDFSSIGLSEERMKSMYREKCGVDQ